MHTPELGLFKIWLARSSVSSLSHPSSLEETLIAADASFAEPALPAVEGSEFSIPV